MFECEMVGSSGHSIQSLKTAEAVDPKTNVVFSEYKVICIRCGKNLEEINKPKQTRTRRVKPAAAAPETPPSLEAIDK